MPLEPRVFATVFGVIFIAELPDKTALLTLILATRYRAVPVFLGTALALVVQTLIAVATGGVLALLPARPVHVAAGVLFLVSAVVMWRGSAEAETRLELRDEPKPRGFKAAFLKTFAVIFVAELGDLTQLGTAALAARYRAPLTVFLASATALISVAALAVLIGNRSRHWIEPQRVQRIAALVFAALGVGFVLGWV